MRNMADDGVDNIAVAATIVLSALNDTDLYNNNNSNTGNI